MLGLKVLQWYLNSVWYKLRVILRWVYFYGYNVSFKTTVVSLFDFIVVVKVERPVQKGTKKYIWERTLTIFSLLSHSLGFLLSSHICRLCHWKAEHQVWVFSHMQSTWGSSAAVCMWDRSSSEERLLLDCSETVWRLQVDKKKEVYTLMEPKIDCRE